MTFMPIANKNPRLSVYHICRLQLKNFFDPKKYNLVIYVAIFTDGIAPVSWSSLIVWIPAILIGFCI